MADAPRLAPTGIRWVDTGEVEFYLDVISAADGHREETRLVVGSNPRIVIQKARRFLRGASLVLDRLERDGWRTEEWDDDGPLAGRRGPGLIAEIRRELAMSETTHRYVCESCGWACVAQDDMEFPECDNCGDPLEREDEPEPVRADSRDSHEQRT